MCWRPVLMKKVLDYIIALTNLYGFVHKDMVVEIYNMHHDHADPTDLVYNWYGDMPAELGRHFIEAYRDSFVHETIMEFHEYDYYLREKANKPFYIPDKEELLRYRDRNYFENTVYYEKLLSYIADAFYRGNERKATMLAEDIQGYCEMHRDEKSHYKLFVHRGLTLEEPGRWEDLRSLIRILGKNTRTWKNNGFTQLELDQIIEEERWSNGTG